MTNKDGTQKIRVILVMATTADGKIARNSKELIDWTGKADKKYFVEQTKKAGVMIMGSTTFDTIGKVLPGRKSIVMTRNKTRISQNPDLVYTDDPPKVILEKLQEEGFSSAALIGGAMINAVFMENDLIDEVHMTVVPKFFGKGLSLFSSSVDAELTLKNTIPMDDGCMILVYAVKRH